MPKKLVFIHTIASLVEPFNKLAAEVLAPEVAVYHIADDIILKEIQTKQKLTPLIYRRVCEHVVDAQNWGADAVMLTCSSIGASAGIAQHMVDIPVLRIDEAMARKAVATGTRIGVAATATTTLGPTSDQVRSIASAEGRNIELRTVLCEGAYAAMIASDTETHDRIVRGYLEELMKTTDVIVLAQASMARVADTIPETEKTVPILSSPRLGLMLAREKLCASHTG